MKKRFAITTMIFFWVSALLVAPDTWAAPQISFRMVADTNTRIPGRSGNFTSFNSLAIAGEKVVFRGFDERGQNGVYQEITHFFGSFLRLVSDENTLASGNGIKVSAPAKTMAFIALGADGQSGIYTDIGDEQTKVIAEGDELDGKIVESLPIFINNDGLSGNRIAFFVGFKDGSKAIYVATVKTEEKGQF